MIRRFAKDLAGQLSGGEISASYKTQERTKTPGGGGAQKVQTGNRRFESDFKLWVAADLTDRRKQLRAEERVAGDVHTVASRKQNVIDASLAAICQFKNYAVAQGCSGNDCPSRRYWKVLASRFQPGCTRRPDGAHRKAVLHQTG